MSINETKPKRGFLDNTNGFTTRVNLYIIQYLCKVEKQKIKPREKGSKLIRNSKEVTETMADITQLSYERLNRILHGEGYSLSKDTSEHIANLLGISTDYFKKNADLVNIHDISREEWECYFYEEYKESVYNLKLLPSEIKKKWQKVFDILNSLTDSSYIPEHYNIETALYHIFYYFRYGTACRADSKLNNFLKDIKELEVSEWKELRDQPNLLKEYKKYLKRHLDYISAYITILKYEK